MGSESPSMATHTVRNQQQLGDFLFSSDLAKLRLGKPGNKARINMNRLREEQLSSSSSSLDNSSGCSASTLTGTEGITNLNYVKNKNTAKKERRKDQVDNAKFQGNGKNSRSASHPVPKEVKLLQPPLPLALPRWRVLPALFEYGGGWLLYSGAELPAGGISG